MLVSTKTADEIEGRIIWVKQRRARTQLSKGYASVIYFTGQLTARDNGTSQTHNCKYTQQKLSTEGLTEP